MRQPLHVVEDGPIIDEYGDKSWYLNEELHREDGPAIEKFIGPFLITVMYCLITFGTYHRAIMSNGETHKFNQPTSALTVGSEHCIDQERVQ
jgi:hypothetical protein